MILRRLTEHVKAQNWFAVFIDFVIVVVGVFVGLQVNNWNGMRAERQRLATALAGLEAESALNITIIDSTIDRIGVSIDKAEAAGRMIEACADDPGSRSVVADAISSLSRDFAPTFISATTLSLGSRDDLLDMLSPEFRAAFSRYRWRVFEEQAQLQTNFEVTWEYHVSRHAGLDADFSQGIRQSMEDGSYLKLPPMATLCVDPGFRHRFMQTSSFISSIGKRLSIMREDVVKFQTVLAEEVQG